MSKTRFAKGSGVANKFHRVLPVEGEAILRTAHENLQTRHVISRMNTRDKCPGAVENIERLLSLKRDLCVVAECPRKSIYWTPKGKYCGKHREEAMVAMRASKRERYGD